MRKTKLYLNRPIYVGFTILDISKVLMYMKQKYASNAKLLFTDTDSLSYEVPTTEYRRDHPLYSTANKKVFGEMKDETHGIPIQEFVGLRPKMYSIKYTEDNRQVEKKTAKEVKKSVTRRKIRYANYKECLFAKKQSMASMNQIGSVN